MRYSLIIRHPVSSVRHGRFIVCIFFSPDSQSTVRKNEPCTSPRTPSSRISACDTLCRVFHGSTLSLRCKLSYRVSDICTQNCSKTISLLLYLVIDRHPPHVVRRLIILTTTNPPHGKTHWKHMVRAGCLLSQTYNISARSTATRSARRFVRSFDTLKQRSRGRIRVKRLGTSRAR